MKESEEKNEMWEGDKWAGNPKFPWKGVQEEERDIVFFSPWIFYLPGVSHLYKKRKQ